MTAVRDALIRATIDAVYAGTPMHDAAVAVADAAAKPKGGTYPKEYDVGPVPAGASVKNYGVGKEAKFTPEQHRQLHESYRAAKSDYHEKAARGMGGMQGRDRAKTMHTAHAYLLHANANVARHGYVQGHAEVSRLASLIKSPSKDSLLSSGRAATGSAAPVKVKTTRAEAEAKVRAAPKPHLERALAHPDTHPVVRKLIQRELDDRANRGM